MTHPNRNRRVGRIEARLLQKEGKAAKVLSIMFYIMDVLMSLWRMRFGKTKGCDDIVFVRYIMAVSYLPDRLYKWAYRMISLILPTPDISILVDVDPVTAMERINDRGETLEIYETVEKLEIVRERMLSLSDEWIVLENSDGVEKLEEQIHSKVFDSVPIR